jgi:hypothetical protein
LLKNRSYKNYIFQYSNPNFTVSLVLARNPEATQSSIEGAVAADKGARAGGHSLYLSCGASGFDDIKQLTVGFFGWGFIRFR